MQYNVGETKIGEKGYIMDITKLKKVSHQWGGVPEWEIRFVGSRMTKIMIAKEEEWKKNTLETMSEAY